MVALTLEIRAYGPDDVEATIAVFQRAIRETASRDYDAAQVAAWSEVDRGGWARARASRPTWVAMSRGEVAGFSDLESNGHVDMMFVHPAHGGAGVASLLLATVEAAAREQGLERLFTEASMTARPFFEKRGFVVEAEQQVHKRGETFTNYRMAKRLT